MREGSDAKTLRSAFGVEGELDATLMHVQSVWRSLARVLLADVRREVARIE